MSYQAKKFTSLISIALSGCIYSLPSIAVEGNNVSPNEAPYMVYLKDAHCTGTLIAPRTVLTAQHCIGLGAKKGSEAYLLHSRAQEQDENGRIPHLGIKVKIVETYTADHIYRINGNFDRDKFDDIAILELENMPEGVTYLPVASAPIPLGAEVFPIGYSTSNLKRMPVPAIVVEKENSPEYEREADMASCHNSKYYSNQYFTQAKSLANDTTCNYLESSYEYRLEHSTYRPNVYSITVENPPLNQADPRWAVNELGTVVTKYSTFRGDSGGPLIYNGKIYGVVSTGRSAHSQLHNEATFYAGFTRPGVLHWIVDTVKRIQAKPSGDAERTSRVAIPVIFPGN